MAPRTDRSTARASKERHRTQRQRHRHDPLYSTHHVRQGYDGPPTAETSITSLSASALAKLNALNEEEERDDYEPVRSPRRAVTKQKRDDDAERQDREQRSARREQRRRKETEDHNHYRDVRKSRRVVSGPMLEDGGCDAYDRRSKWRDKPRLPGSDMTDYEAEEARKKNKRKWLCSSHSDTACIQTSAKARPRDRQCRSARRNRRLNCSRGFAQEEERRKCNHQYTEQIYWFSRFDTVICARYNLGPFHLVRHYRFQYHVYERNRRRVVYNGFEHDMGRQQASQQ